MTTKPGGLISQLLTADELVRWPLMHGTLAYGDELNGIKANGLIAGRATNSYNYDEAVGRNACVFLAPATFRLQYGFGRSSILIDPLILARKGLRCSDRDVGEVFDALRIITKNPKNYVGDAREPSSLEEFVVEVKTKCGVKDPEETALAVFRSERFKQYVSRNYEFTVDELFRQIERGAGTMTLRKYFSRTSLWKEEILVPKAVEPDYLLGHWDGRDWTEWKRPVSQETQARVEAWLEAAAAFVRR